MSLFIFPKRAFSTRLWRAVSPALSTQRVHSFSTTAASAVPEAETHSLVKKRSKKKKKRDAGLTGLNLSKTKGSVVEGSFLLTDEGKNKAVYTAAEALNESVSRNQYSDILIRLQAQNQGANISLFYKQNGGVVATRGQGALIFQDPQFSRTGEMR